MYDLVVLGGGAGGLSVALEAARVGARVALIEKYTLGGECTHSACVPSKGLIQAARLVHQIRSAGDFGIRVAAPKVDFAAVMARVRAVVYRFAGSDSGDSLRARGIDVYRGSPAFEAYDTVILDGKTRIEAHRFVIATGSRPARPRIPGLAEAGALDNTTLWDLDALPSSLVILGAGPTGLEFAQVFARLGSKVTVLADSRHVLPHEDPEVSDCVEALLAAEGIAFRTGVEVTGVEVRDGLKVCTYRDPASGTTGEASGTQLLVAAGRLANVEGLNLEAVGIHASPEHGIEVDDYLQTRSTRILAIGDVLNRHQYTHAAEREAAVAFQNAVLRLSKKIDYTAMPWATFVDPEVATVGLSEAAARGASRQPRLPGRVLRDRPRPDRRPDRRLRQAGRDPLGQDPRRDDRGRGREPDPPGIRARDGARPDPRRHRRDRPYLSHVCGHGSQARQPVRGDPPRSRLRPDRAPMVPRVPAPDRCRRRHPLTRD